MDFDPRNVPELPKLMKRKGWLVGASLMERWLAGDAYVRQSRDPIIETSIDTTVVKIDWALKFHGGFIGFRDLLANKLWANERAQSEIKRMLERKKLLGNKPSRFGDPTALLVTQDKDYITHQKIAADYPLTDLTAALANSTYRVLVYGTVWPDKETSVGGPGANRRYTVNIEQLGVYIFDSYDFIDDKLDKPQDLGYWDLSDDAVGLTSMSGNHVTNKTLRDYRDKSGKGCDFLVFSNLKRWTLPTPTIFSIVSSYSSAEPPNPSLLLPKSSHSNAVPTSLPAQRSGTTKVYEVREGDTLSGRSDRFYGSYELWPLIFKENRNVIGLDPRRIRKATRLTIPPLQSFAPARVADARRRWRQEMIR